MICVQIRKALIVNNSKGSFGTIAEYRHETARGKVTSRLRSRGQYYRIYSVLKLLTGFALAAFIA
ncbi:MAG: hypothetical protein ACI815_000898 [Psychroserpens sp.]|jgi:hypothetical protein